jgi:predicted SAM-dependent methyltransferase|tara:strand:+ start:436 stop:966 length:531 start_codon:yes stop_codon:yes gene_type:complete
MKLNVGCGERDFGGDWIHIDGHKFSHVNSDDIWLKEYQNDIVDLLYTSHFIAYFDREEIVTLLKRWREVIKPGGKLRIATPDFKQIAFNTNIYSLDNFVGPLYGKWNMNGEYIYHKTVYDFGSLKKLLLSVGFKDVKRYDWRETSHSEFDDHSQAYLPHMDKENGTLISLNMECVK